MEFVTEFKDLKFPESDRRISSFKFVPVYGHTRIYYQLNDPDKRLGFDFYVTEFYAAFFEDYNKCKDVYQSEGFQASCLFWGHVYWDGLRHLFMGDEETATENYLYYANTIDISKVFLKLRELEKLFCNKDQLEE